MTTKKVNRIQKTESQRILDQIYLSREFRKELANNNMFWFFSIYFPHYIQYKSAKFQKEIFSLVSDDNIQIVAITAFRNSAKSTICTLVLPIWGIVGKWKKKYVVIVCQNQSRAKDTLVNIRMELETMGILVQDYQPREGKVDKWSENTIVIPKYGAKISVISIGEGIRGMRYLQYRPDLIICDDLEDVPSCQNYESRKKLWQFVNGELIPAGDKNTKYVFVGNKVHNDSLMMKLKKAIESKKMKGVYREYPLIDENGKITWPGKFPNMKAIDKLKATYASEIDYLREQMLMILPDGDAIVKPEDIHYYKELPMIEPEFYFLSIDPAFSQKTTADKTAIVLGVVYKISGKLKVNILSGGINERLTVPEIIKKIKNILSSFEAHTIVRVFVEGGSAQKGLIQMLQYEGIQAEEVNIKGQDKESRLYMASNWIKTGVISFPVIKSEELIRQIVYFGTERYDDLVDALTLFVIAMLERESRPKQEVIMINLQESIQDALYRRALGPQLVSSKAQGKDWAELDDEKIFKSLRMKNPKASTDKT